MTIADRIVDARLLAEAGRWEGALLGVLVAVAATARRRFPKRTTRDGDAFERFLAAELPKQTGITLGPIQVQTATGMQTIERTLYEWFRCHLVHEASLPPTVTFEGDADGPAFFQAATNVGDPFRLGRAWLRIFMNVVTDAPENSVDFAGAPPPHDRCAACGTIVLR